MLIDTHCHIHDRATYDFAISRQQVSKKLLRAHPEIPHEKADFIPEKILARARANGIEKMITVGTSHLDSLEACRFAAEHDDVFWSYGIHPDEAGTAKNGFFWPGAGSAEPERRDPATAGVADASRKKIFSSACLIAIGEVGLDYRNGTDNRKQQIDLFEQMLDLASDRNLPCIFHVRDAFDDFFAVLDNFPKIEQAVVHSFSDSPENLKKSLDRGFYIGINGLATFADIYPDRLPPLDRTLLETDAPFLAPVPVRGHVNEPAYIKDIAEFLAKRHHLEFDKIAETTTKNAEKLFNI